jgi:para-nitrobenzyl esterase
MKKITFFFGIIALLSFCVNPKMSMAQVDENPIVQTPLGKVRGSREGNVEVFKGIPYAAPPIGEFRWRPPQPVKAWQGEKDATKFGANAAQAGWPRKPGTIAEGSSEDCLFLNVWRPAGIGTKNKLPVMVWIHGGGFVAGSGSSLETSGNSFVQQGVIFVSINYRLGRLGFFAFPALQLEHVDEFKGNYAFMDQIAALEWIQKNITAFGGDPKNVTIFGESAGGVSVHSLLTIPAAKGLFHKAILESSGGRDGVLTGRPLNQENADSFYPISAEQIGINFARRHGINGTDANALAQLRALPTSEIVDGGEENDGPGGKRIYSGPILDGKLVVETSQSAYLAGRQSKVPIIIGSNSAEVPAGFVNAGSKEELFSMFGPLKEEAIAAYDPEGKIELPELLTRVNTDKVWAEPARFTAQAFEKIKIPAYIYQFSYVAESLKDRLRYGAPHASEIPYVFNTLESRRGNVAVSKTDKEVAILMHTYWANFVKSGNPNGSQLPVWPVYHSKKNEVLEFQSDGKAVGKKDPKKEKLDVIEKEVKYGKLQKNGV